MFWGFGFFFFLRESCVISVCLGREENECSGEIRALLLLPDPGSCLMLSLDMNTQSQLLLSSQKQWKEYSAAQVTALHTSWN